MTSVYRSHLMSSYLNISLLEVSNVDLFADNVGSHVISLQEAEADLLQDEVGLFALLHGSKRLNLKYCRVSK